MSNDAIAVQRQTLAALDVKRKSLELEAEGIVSELTAKPPNGNGEPMGIDTPLTDSDGYPRADIDVYRARTLRNRLSIIRTDHKELMQQIDTGLKQLAAMQDPNSKEEEKEELEKRLQPKPKPKFDPVTKKWVVMNWDGSVAGAGKGGERRSFDRLEETEKDGDAVMNDVVVNNNKHPFAIIDAVASDSPAAEANLKEGDLIVQFGSVDYTNHRNLLAIGELVPQAAGNQSSIDLVVLRNNQQEEVKLILRPRPWNGRGLLGCHVKPYSGEA